MHKGPYNQYRAGYVSRGIVEYAVLKMADQLKDLSLKFINDPSTVSANPLNRGRLVIKMS